MTKQRGISIVVLLVACFGSLQASGAVAPETSANGAVPDGRGGVIVARGAAAYRVNPAGVSLWPEGVPISDGSLEITSRVAVSDERGGALIGYSVREPGRPLFSIYVQRLGPSGHHLWGSPGIRVAAGYGANFSDAPYGVSPSYAAQIAPDGSGGAIITWFSDPQTLMAQRLDARGGPQWGPDGLVAAGLGTFKREAHPVPDLSGGATVVWNEQRGPRYGSFVWAQHLDGAGRKTWAVNGVLLSPWEGQFLHGAADGAGGIIASWVDFRGPDHGGNLNGDIFAQRVDASGALLWTDEGRPGCVNARVQDVPLVTPDGTGGAILSWLDIRSDADPGDRAQVRAQRVDGDGVRHWDADGIILTDAWFGLSRLATDGLGGAFVVEKAAPPATEVVARHVDADGEFDRGAGDRIADDGDIVAVVPTHPGEAMAILSDPDGVSGHVLRARAGGRAAGRALASAGIDGDRSATAAAPKTVLELERRGTSADLGAIALRLELHSDARVSLVAFDLQGRKVRDLIRTSLAAGEHRIDWDGRSDGGPRVARGLYFLRLQVDGQAPITTRVALW